MKPERQGLLPVYRAALGRYLKQGSVSSLQQAPGLGRRALACGLATLDLAQIHEHALLSVVEALQPATNAAHQERLVRRAGTFFAKALLPLEATHRTVVEANAQVRELKDAMDRRTRDLSASNRKLKREVTRRTVAEETLRKNEAHAKNLLAQARHMQNQLRLLSRRVLSAQEEERKRVSRELHDIVAQMLTGINAQLAVLKKDATSNTKGMVRKISNTQRLVEKSVNIIHRFARELRPAVLDDLGLIPALHSHLKSFANKTGIRVHLTAFAGVEGLSNATRTALYRVAQEALSNVASHAQASRVEVTLERLSRSIHMSIKDNGKSFDVDRALCARRSKRLGLLGMRERMEMIDGTFAVESAADHGTTIHAHVPFNRDAREPVGS